MTQVLYCPLCREEIIREEVARIERSPYGGYVFETPLGVAGRHELIAEEHMRERHPLVSLDDIRAASAAFVP